MLCEAPVDDLEVAHPVDHNVGGVEVTEGDVAFVDEGKNVDKLRRVAAGMGVIEPLFLVKQPVSVEGRGLGRRASVRFVMGRPHRRRGHERRRRRMGGSSPLPNVQIAAINEVE